MVVRYNNSHEKNPQTHTHSLHFTKRRYFSKTKFILTAHREKKLESPWFTDAIEQSPVKVKEDFNFNFDFGVQTNRVKSPNL